MDDQEKEFIEIIKKHSRQLPHFPDGRINYTNSKTAPVVNVFVFWQDKLLLLHRSDKVSAYKGKWDVVGGYLDEIKSPLEQAKEELREELRIDESILGQIKLVDLRERYDKEIDTTWIIALVLVKLNKQPEIKLDWEHTGYKWIDPEDLDQYDHIPGMEVGLAKVLKVRKAESP